jgi:hypothetical protein
VRCPPSSIDPFLPRGAAVTSSWLSPLERRDGMGCEEGEGVKTEEVNGTSTATLLIIRPIVILILIDYCT